MLFAQVEGNLTSVFLTHFPGGSSELHSGILIGLYQFRSSLGSFLALRLEYSKFSDFE